MSKLVRISQGTYNKLSELVKEMGSSKQEILDQALEKLSRELFLKGVSEDYERLRSNPTSWQDYLEERAEWESINDKLEDL